MNRRFSLCFFSGLTVVALALAPLAARAEVRRDGQWPDADPPVTLDVDGVPRSEALNRLAKAAGWSIVVSAPKGDPVSLHVSQQPAGKVLDLLLADGRYVARRDQSLISISPDTGDATRAPSAPTPPTPLIPPALPAAPPPPPPPPSAAAAEESDDDDRDRTVTGGSLRIEKGEVVHDVSVLGGNLDVWGTVTGDLAVLGGAAHIHEGAHVKGDATVMGGALDVESGAAIDGDVGVLGGKLNRAEGARIGGEIKEGVHRDKSRREARKEARKEAGDKAKTSARTWAREAIDAINAAALLFVFGAVLLALMPDRMDKLRLQVAARPMRSFATGVVSIIAGVVLLAAVSVTIIGIPVAAVAAFAAVIATFAGMCSVLETAGAALLGHRTRNPYVHLAFGSVLFLILGAIPFLGGLVKIAVVLTAIGSVVSTRAAGLVPTKNRAVTAYRDAAST